MRTAFGIPAAVLFVAAVAAAISSWKEERAIRQLTARLAAVQGPTRQPVEPCLQTLSPRPLVLLILGQSNAGNHGAGDESQDAGHAGNRVRVFVGSGCQVVADPLPGGTGHQGSIWSRLPAQLQRLGERRPVVIALLAVDASSIREWTDRSSPLAARLGGVLGEMRAAELRPDFVLWQQGEADALSGTTEVEYRQGLERVRALVRVGGVSAPILAARSTLCRTSNGAAVGAALVQMTARHPDFRLGPNTDALTDDHRSDGCHFSRRGLDAAAALWAAAILRQQG